VGQVGRGTIWVRPIGNRLAIGLALAPRKLSDASDVPVDRPPLISTLVGLLGPVYAPEAVPNAVRNVQPVPVPLCGPYYSRCFLCRRDIPGHCTETPDQIVVQMEWLLFLGGNTVNIDARQLGNSAESDADKGFLMGFARSGRSQGSVRLLDMSAR
jgi:hypothetical protein